MTADDSISANGKWSDRAVVVCSFWALPALSHPARPWPQLCLWQGANVSPSRFSYSTGSKRGRCCLPIWQYLSVSMELLSFRASCFGDPSQPCVYKQPRGRGSPAGWGGLPGSDYTCTCNSSLLPGKALRTNPCPLALLFVLLCSDLKWIPSRVPAAGQTAVGTCGDNGCAHL